MRFKVRVTNKAYQSIIEIREWLRQKSPDGVIRWIEAYEHAIERLKSHADTFSESAESKRFSEPLYEVYFKTPAGKRYRLVYVLRSTDVIVMDLRSPGQRLLNPRTTPLP